MFLDQYIDKNGVYSDYPIFEDNIYKELLMPTTDLLLAQYQNSKFNAVDVAVKSLAIKNYYGKNDNGFELYNKMQFYRTSQNWEKRFVNLIESFKDGYDLTKSIDVDVNYSIHDGAHRLALLLYHNIDSATIKLFNTFLYRRSYTIDWFYKYFNEEELDLINKELSLLLDSANKPYVCILWPPAHKIFNQIKSDLSKDFEIVNHERLLMDDQNLKKFIYDVYKTDDIKIEKLNLKYNYMKNSINKDRELFNLYPVDVLNVKIDNPNFRLKPITGLPQSKKTMAIKKLIRNNYQNDIIDYYYDIMIHMTDNEKQNKEVKQIIKKIGGNR